MERGAEEDRQIGLTIAIVTFRRPEGLRACLASVVPQIGPGMELLVVDNDAQGSAGPVCAEFAPSGLRYVVEPAPGVSNARNRAVVESRGDYLAFIDDDEVAAADWVAALLRHVGQGVGASFGKVVPAYDSEPAAGTKAILDRLYTRDLGKEQDAVISAQWAHVGTGNSLFCKAVCFDRERPFAVEMNATGGEDVRLAKSLVEQGIDLVWNPAAQVEERVPAARLELRDLCSRRYRQGQQRVVLARQTGGWRNLGAVGTWMAVGVVQTCAFGARAAALYAVGRPAWRSALPQMSGGLGKVLWWRLWRDTSYATR